MIYWMNYFRISTRFFFNFLRDFAIPVVSDESLRKARLLANVARKNHASIAHLKRPRDPEVPDGAERRWLIHAIEGRTCPSSVRI